MRRHLRIVVCGDSQSGKSALITALLAGSFTPQPNPASDSQSDHDQIPPGQSVLPPVQIPADVTPERVSTTVVDSPSPALSSSHPSAPSHASSHATSLGGGPAGGVLEQELRKAHAIVLVCAIDDPRALDRVGRFWFPFFRSLGLNLPVILARSKADLRPSTTYHPSDRPGEELQAELGPLMARFRELETSVEVSAIEGMNVPELFYFAQKAVMHPASTLYDVREHALKPAAEQALVRIFTILSHSSTTSAPSSVPSKKSASSMSAPGTGGSPPTLSLADLNAFQVKCFNAPLQHQELQGILDLLAQQNPHAVHPPFHPASRTHSTSTSSSSAGTEGVPSTSALTLEGFLTLHRLYIQKGRTETTWDVLRAFGYAEDLTLTEEFLHPKSLFPLLMFGCPRR